MFAVCKKLAVVIETKYEPIRVGLGIFGFDVPHVHIHLFPMHDKSDIVPNYVLKGKRPTTSFGQQVEVTKEISRLLD